MCNALYLYKSTAFTTTTTTPLKYRRLTFHAFMTKAGMDILQSSLARTSVLHWQYLKSIERSTDRRSGIVAVDWKRLYLQCKLSPAATSAAVCVTVYGIA